MSVIIQGSGGVTTNSGAVYDGISRGTSVASTSGTSVDFTSIPSWVKRITVMFNGVSTNGSSNKLVQLGTVSGIASSGYVSTGAYTQATAGTASSTAGFIIFADNAAFLTSGTMTLCLLGSNVWVSNHTAKASTSQLSYGGGDITLGGTLDRIRITTVNGTDTFDAGSINILYE
jgi:hypothetical protein